jgi:hypothetical protein
VVARGENSGMLGALIFFLRQMHEWRATPAQEGKSWAIRGPETIASIGLLPLTKDQGAIDAFERRMRKQAC